MPPLAGADRDRLSCATFPEIKEILETQEPLVFLSGTNGEAIVTDGQFKWVRFDIVNRREAELIRFGDVRARGVHFECFDDLNWLSSVYVDLEE